MLDWAGERRAGTGSEQGQALAGWDRKQRRTDSSGRARHDPAFVYGGEGGKGRSAEGRRPSPARGAAQLGAGSPWTSSSSADSLTPPWRAPPSPQAEGRRHGAAPGRQTIAAAAPPLRSRKPARRASASRASLPGSLSCGAKPGVRSGRFHRYPWCRCWQAFLGP